MKGIGLVFAGGGGKGAYQIGVWKYLHEQGLDRYVQAASGTSVGALNAAFFVGSSYERAEAVWESIQTGQILTPKDFSEQLKSVLRVFKLNYCFSRSGIQQLIQDGVDFIQLQQSTIPCYAACLESPVGPIKYFLLNDYDDEIGEKILLASSAIPIIFKEEVIEGKSYIDGGVPQLGDNVPVQPLYEKQIETIIVVHLGRDQLIDKSRFPGTKIIEIVPQNDLGGPLSGTLDFTSEGAKWRIEQGYQDAKRILDPMIHILELDAVNQRMLAEAAHKERIFQQERQALRSRGSEITAQISGIRSQMADDEFDELYEELMKGGDRDE